MIRLRRAGPVTQIAMARGVFGRPLFTACAYYLDRLLIDTGPPVTSHEMERALQGMPVEAVILTHAHEDHGGANLQLQARGVTPLAHPLALEILARPPYQRPYQRALWGRLAASEAAPIGEEVATRAFHFRVIQTPGHSADHLSFLEERTGWLFAGDLYLSAYVKVLRQDENPHQTISSLRTVLSLPVTTLFCASGKMIEDGRGALQRKLDFMERLRDEARDRQARGMDARRITLELLGRETWWPLVTGGHFSKQNLIDALLRAEGGTAERQHLNS